MTISDFSPANLVALRKAARSRKCATIRLPEPVEYESWVMVPTKKDGSGLRQVVVAKTICFAI